MQANAFISFLEPQRYRKISGNLIAKVIFFTNFTNLFNFPFETFKGNKFAEP